MNDTYSSNHDPFLRLTWLSSFAHEKALSFDPEGVSVVYYHLLKDEGHYATFQFFYRSRSTLKARVT